MLRHHVCALIFRISFFSASIYVYFTDIEALDFTAIPRFNFGGVLLIVIMFVFVIGMLFRIIPNKRIAIGAGKHYSCFYTASVDFFDEEEIITAQKRLHRGAFLSGLGWAVVTALLLIVLVIFNALTPAAVVIIALFYSVIDLVFILTFCPFRVLFMRNRCCTVCRIYNWDYFMMCAPLIVFPSFYSVALTLMSAVVLIRWELAIKKNVHYFMPETNENLKCENCKDGLTSQCEGENSGCIAF